MGSMPDFDDDDGGDTDAKPSPAANPRLATAPDADEQRLPLSHGTPGGGTRAGHRTDNSSFILIRELSLIRSAFVEQASTISGLHKMITRVQEQQAAFEERFSAKMDDVLMALKACEGCSRVERIEMQIEKLRDR